MSKDSIREAVISQVIQLLHNERKRQKLSMNAVAKRSGLSQSMVSLVERNLRNPTLDTLLRIAGVLRIDLGPVISRAHKTATGR